MIALSYGACTLPGKPITLFVCTYGPAPTWNKTPIWDLAAQTSLLCILTVLSCLSCLSEPVLPV